eukprot:COSAG06_NODE_54595_length_293_cov_11.592784_1_plen_91_part_01
MPLVELFYYADGDCEFGCAAAVDEVHSVVDAEHAEACESLGLVACAGPSDHGATMVCVSDGSDCDSMQEHAGDSVDEDMCAALGLVLCSAS